MISFLSFGFKKSSTSLDRLAVPCSRSIGDKILSGRAIADDSLYESRDSPEGGRPSLFFPCQIVGSGMQVTACGLRGFNAPAGFFLMIAQECSPVRRW